MADFGRRAARIAEHFKADRRSPVAHLLWPNRCSSPAADSRVEKTLRRFVSRRRCDRGHE
jgi:hypothetical protein